MIYIFAGSDIKKVSAAIKSISKDHLSTPVPSSEVSASMLKNAAQSTSLFGESSILIFQNALSEADMSLSSKDLAILQGSKTVFIFREDKLLATDMKRYAKHASIERYDEKKISKPSQNDAFLLATAFGQKDKIKAWMLYSDAIESGASPEAISGMIFWKIKSMIMDKNTKFEIDNLKRQSGELVSLYHRAHRGELDFSIALERFILCALT